MRVNASLEEKKKRFSVGDKVKVLQLGLKEKYTDDFVSLNSKRGRIIGKTEYFLVVKFNRGYTTTFLYQDLDKYVEIIKI